MFLLSIQIDQPYLWPPDFLLKGSNLTNYAMVAYSKFVSQAAVVIRDSIGGGTSNETIIRDTEDMINFHIELANVSSCMI